LVEKGKANEEAGKYEEAINYYKEAVEANPFISLEGLISEAGAESVILVVIILIS
jgi:tetratricopeptide (TPR) repeat protein